MSLVARSIEARPSRRVHGALAVPGDKSISHRSILLSALATGTSEIRGFLASEDCLASLAAMRALGVRIEERGTAGVLVHGAGLHGLKGAAHPLDMGNAGTAMRLFAGLLAAQQFDSRLIGDESLMQRPMERVAKPLREMGAAVRTHDGKPPLDISGGRRLEGIDYLMPVASAQVKSSVLLAGLYAEGATTVTAPAVCRDHSERMLMSAGVRVESHGLSTTVYPPQRLESQHLEIPGDFSSAAFFIVAGLLGAAPDGLLLKNVGLNPTRTGLLDILRSMGGQIEVENARKSGAEPVGDLRVRASRLKGVEVAPSWVALAIDEFPVLFIAAACAEGETVVSGAEELRVKESDRIAVMASGLRALGVEHSVTPDGMRIVGRPHGSAFSGGLIDSRGDHRIAMSFSVASLRAEDPITVRDTANVATSFPGFVELARSAGLDLIENVGSPLVSPPLVPVIAIDGPSGSGKGTISRAVAAALGLSLLDSGALYRLVALAARRAGVGLDDPKGLSELAMRFDIRFGAGPQGEEIVRLDGVEVTRAIRTEAAGNDASKVAALPAVRAALLERQRAFAVPPGLVADGRDMGTVVFPGAGLKIFLTASPEERALRRHKQLKEKGVAATLAALSLEIAERDQRDISRSASPLVASADAVVLDTTGMSVNAVVERVLGLVRGRQSSGHL